MSAVGYITVHRAVCCRLTNGGVARAEFGGCAGGAHFVSHRWVTGPVLAPARLHVAKYLGLPIPRIGRTDAA